MVPAPPQTPYDVAQTVDTLMVRNQLLTNKQLGATLTLTGSGSARPTYEAALCVKAGAQFDGLTEHGLLRVRGNSCMRGPLSVSNLYGPVTVSADPTTTNPAGVQLTVDGGAETTSLATALLEADEATLGDVTALTASIGELNTTVFTVDGVLAGPFAPAVVTALVSNAAAAVRIVGPAGPQQPEATFTGVAVGPAAVLVAVTSEYTTYHLGADITSIQVYLPRYLGSAAAVAATVTSCMPAANLLLLSLSSLTTSIFFGPAAIANEVQDSPLPNTPMLVAYANVDTGTIGFTSAAVEDGFGQLFSEYTSVHVRPDAALPDGALGGPIVDARGKLVALVQYGTPGAAVAYGASKYGRVTGGVKARFLKFFLDNAEAAAIVALPALQSGYVSRPITFGDRFGGISGLLAGGAAIAPTLTATSSQVMSIHKTTGTEFYQSLGTAGVNFPNIPEILLASYDSSAVYELYTSTPGTLTTSANACTDPAYWNNGAPYYPFNGSPIDPLHPYSTSFLWATSRGVALSELTSLIVTGYTSGASGTNYAVSCHGTATDTQIHSGAIIAWGSLGSLEVYFAGLGGEGSSSSLTNTISSAFADFASGLAPSVTNVFAVGGAVGDVYTFANVPTASSSQSVVLTKTPAGIDVAVGATTFNFTYGSQYSIFDFTVNNNVMGLSQASDPFKYFASVPGQTVTTPAGSSSSAPPTPT